MSSSLTAHRTAVNLPPLDLELMSIIMSIAVQVQRSQKPQSYLAFGPYIKMTWQELAKEGKNHRDCRQRAKRKRECAPFYMCAHALTPLPSIDI